MTNRDNNLADLPKLKFGKLVRKKMLANPVSAAPDTKHQNPLPKKGAVCVQWVRCCQPGCRCSRGELHGPYYYLFWREDGRLRKRYVRVADVAAVIAGCQARREQEQQLRTLTKKAWKQWQAIKAQLQGVN